MALARPVLPSPSKGAPENASSDGVFRGFN
jgi:hypothetical protein